MFVAALAFVVHIFAAPLVVCEGSSCPALDQPVGAIAKPAADAPANTPPLVDKSVGPVAEEEPSGLLPFATGVGKGLVVDTLTGLWSLGRLTVQGAGFTIAHPIQAAENVGSVAQATGSAVKSAATDLATDPVGTLTKAKDSTLSAGSAALDAVKKSCSGMTESCGDLVGNVAGALIPVGDAAKLAGLAGKTGEALNLGAKVEQGLAKGATLGGDGIKAERLTADAAGAATLEGGTTAAGGPLRFSQTSASPLFDKEGDFAGKTIGQLAASIRSGETLASSVKVGYVTIDGQKLIVNTRSSLALMRAGIPQSQWSLVDRTATDKGLIEARLAKNKLTSAGTPTLYITGKGKTMSNLE